MVRNAETLTEKAFSGIHVISTTAFTNAAGKENFLMVMLLSLAKK